MFVVGPVSLSVGGTTEAEVIGFDQYGKQMDLPAGTTVTYSIDAPSVASSTPNADGLTDAVVGVAAGTANLTASVSGPSGPITDTEVVTVVPAPSVLSSIKIQFGS